jgi:hypothetical protein
MENKKERVLAYTLAKTIKQEDLEAVSGGISLTHRESMRPSGGSGQGSDIFMDVTVDW